MNNLKNWDMDGRLFWMLRTAEAELEVRDDNFDYYGVTIHGYRLMYRQNRWRPDAKRCYKLGNELAKALGFADEDDMRWCCPKVQYHRGWLSVAAIERHFR